MSGALARLLDDQATAEEEQDDRDTIPLLNLAHRLTALLHNTRECCTPGHHMGRSYALLRATVDNGAAFGRGQTTGRPDIRR